MRKHRTGCGARAARTPTVGYYNVALYSDARPLAGIDSRGAYSGIDNYFCLYLFDRTRVRVNIVPVDPRDRYDVLLSGEADVCVSGMSPSDKRADEVVFTNPIYRVRLAIASPNEAKIESEDQLAGKTLIVAEGSYAEYFINTKTSLGLWPEMTIKPCATNSSARDALVAGYGDALLEDEISLLFWAKQTPGFNVFMSGIGKAREIGPALAPGQDELYEKIASATTAFISNKWARVACDTLVLPVVGEEYSNMLVGVKQGG